MVKLVLLAALCTLALSSAQLESVPHRLRTIIKVKSASTIRDDAFGSTESNFDAHPIRILRLSMSMSADDISVLNIDDADEAVDADGAVDADDADKDLGAEGAVDWICQFCPSFLCINCA